MFKVMLINPPMSLEHRYGKGMKNIGTVLPPLGLAYLASMLEKHSHKVKILDTQLFDLGIKETVDECKKFMPDIIGIYTLTSSFETVVKLSKLLKKELNVKIVIGGAHPTIEPIQALKDNNIDFSIIGEGEYTFVELLSELEKPNPNLKKIKGIAFKHKGKIIFNKPRPPIKNLDALPFPARHLLKMNLYKPSPNHYKQLPYTTMVASRGCPYACTFCSSSNIWNQKYTTRSVKNVIEEIKFLKKEYGIKDIGFWDDLWGINPKWIGEFCKAIKKSNLDISWSCELRADSASREILKKMADAGCWCIFYGIESLDQDILNAVNKRTTKQQMVNALKWTKEAGIEIRANFILALPRETPQKVKKMLKELINIDMEYVKFNVLTPYPGTKLYEEIKQGKWGRMKEDKSKLTGYHVTFVPFGYKDAKEVEKMKRYAFRKFYLRPKFIMKQILSIKSKQDLIRHIKGFKAIINI